MIPCRLQDVGVVEFEALQANDILFIDSTHVSKIDSDVNYIFFEILSRLAPGLSSIFMSSLIPSSIESLGAMRAGHGMKPTC